MRRLILLSCLVFAASLATLAQAPGSTPSTGSNQAQPQFLSFKSHALKATYISNGTYSGTVFPAGDQGVDGIHTVTCPGTGTCTLQVDGWIEVGGVSNAQNQAGLCFYVDEKPISDTCFYSGVVPADGTYAQISSSHSQGGLKHGSHKVQVHVYTFYGTAIFYYNFNYKVFTP